MKNTTLSAVLVAGAFALSAPASAATQAALRKAEIPGTAQSPDQRHRFLQMAIMDDNAEIMFGQMAEKRGPAINTLGVMLVQDHMQARDRADKIAKAEGLALPTQLSSSASQQRLKLEKLSGPQFNYQFVRYIIKDHRRAITAYRREGKKIGPVAGLARSTLPDLEKHLRVALGLVQQGV